MATTVNNAYRYDDDGNCVGNRTQAIKGLYFEANANSNNANSNNLSNNLSNNANKNNNALYGTEGGTVIDLTVIER